MTVRISLVIRMPVWASRNGRALSPDVLLGRYGFEVFRINAGAVPAEMIDLKAGGDRPYVNLI